VRLAVVDVTGRVVRVLLDGEAPAGSNRVVWDGRSDAGDRLASGVYFFRLDAGEQSRTLKTTLLR
jgi:flagellar hook assembly protein FlgD